MAMHIANRRDDGLPPISIYNFNRLLYHVFPGSAATKAVVANDQRKKQREIKLQLTS